MGFLFSSGTQSTTPTKLTGIPVQTSVQGVCCSLVFGQTRIAGNLIWYGDFKAVGVSSSSGKGGASSGKGGYTSYNYYASFIIGLCEGPIGSIGDVWNSTTLETLAKSGLSLFKGAVGQSGWGFLSTNHADQYLNYSGLCYVAVANYELDSSAAVPSFNFEVAGLCRTVSGQVDCDPKEVITYLLSNTDNGVGYPSDHIGDLGTYSAYCLASGFLISPAYTDQQTASEILKNIALLTNSEFYESEGKLCLAPYGDEAVSGNGVTYAPPTAPEYDLDDDDFLDSGDQNGPVRLTRARPADQYNYYTLEFLDRDNEYNVATTDPAQDLDAIQKYGLRMAGTQTAHEFCTKAPAQKSAWCLLQRQKILNTYTFKLGVKYIGLDCMDLVTLTDAALGLDKQWVRIKSIAEDENLDLEITAEEYLAGTGAAALTSWQTPNGYFADRAGSSGNCNVPVIFEPPGKLVQDLEIWAAVSGGSNWGGCDVYVSTDGASYKKVGEIQGNARQGVLAAQLPAGSKSDTVNPLSLDLSMSRATLLSGSETDFSLLNTLCYVDGEWLAYKTATLTGTYQYSLTVLNRGAYGSTISTHAAGAQFVRVDDFIFKYPYDSSLIGLPVYLKFVGKNLYGQAVQDIADVAVYTYFPTGIALTAAPGDIADLAASYYAGQLRLSWDAVDDWRDIDYEIRKGVSWDNSKFLFRTSLTHCPYWGDGTYWVAAHYRSPNGVDAYSANATSLVLADGMLTTNVIQSYDEQALGWLGTLTNLTSSGGYLYLTGADYSSGIYQVPTSHQVDIGRDAACNVLITYDLNGDSTKNDVLTITDILQVADILGEQLGLNISAQPQIRVKKDGGSWGDWQNYIPGEYYARCFDARILLGAASAELRAILQGFTFAVDVPDRTDTGTGVAIAAAGTTISYSSAFNAVPNLQITIVGGSAGDAILLSSQTVSGFTIQIVNDGSGVARSINWVARGY